MMTDTLKGKTEREVEDVFERFHDLVTGRSGAGLNGDVADASAASRPPIEARPSSDRSAPELRQLAVFSGVSEVPVRVRWATLAWHRRRAALEQKAEPVTTE